MDGARELSGSIFEACSFLQKKAVRRGRNFNVETPGTQAGLYVLLQTVYLMAENSGKGIGIERLICDHGVDAIDELRGVHLTHRCQSKTLQLTLELGPLGRRRHAKSHVGMDLLDHIPRPQVAREKNQSLLEVDVSIVAKPEVPLVQDAEQQSC